MYISMQNIQIANTKHDVCLAKKIHLRGSPGKPNKWFAFPWLDHL